MNLPKLKKSLPTTPGVYLMKNRAGKILYVGKAANLKRRVLSYFQRPARIASRSRIVAKPMPAGTTDKSTDIAKQSVAGGPQEYRIARMVAEVSRVDVQKTDTVIEALMLEARLIKQYQPHYNVLEKDDKSFLYVVIPREPFPRVLALREKESLAHDRPLGRFGPFTSSSAIREALHILRRIFPYNTHANSETLRQAQGILKRKLVPERSTVKRGAVEGLPLKEPRPCFNYHIGLCPGTCAGLISPTDYRKIVRQIMLFFQGKKKRIFSELKKEMNMLAKTMRYEEAAVIRRRIAALAHIRDVAVIRDAHALAHQSLGEGGGIHRIEGYDISNISGTSSVGSMVVFTDGVPDKAQYRKFRIKTVTGPNDVAMLGEVIRRRMRHAEWQMPDIILVDGGLPQVNAARSAISALRLAVPVVGIAKGKERKRNDFLYPPELHDVVRRNRDVFVNVRDEAHRFAIRYHRELRARRQFEVAVNMLK